MGDTIFCKKLNQDAEQLARPPIPGPLGQRIFNEISKPAWTMWLAHQTMLINEYRLNLSETSARDFLKQEMEQFFFGTGSQKPSGYNEHN